MGRHSISTAGGTLPGGTHIIVSGPRQTGKTSVVLRIARQLEKKGRTPLYINAGAIAPLETLDDFLWHLLEALWDARDLPMSNFPSQRPDVFQPPGFLELVRKKIIGEPPSRVVVVLDEVDIVKDRQLTWPLERQWYNQFYATLRTISEQRAVSAHSPFDRMDLILVVSRRPETIITNPLQSPFNVGLPLALDSLSMDECATLWSTYGDEAAASGGRLPPGSPVELMFQLLGGQPQMTRTAFYHLASGTSLGPLQQLASTNGIFADHLKAVLRTVARTKEHRQSLHACLRGERVDDPAAEALVEAGILRRRGKRVEPHNAVYAEFLRQHL